MRVSELADEAMGVLRDIARDIHAIRKLLEQGRNERTTSSAPRSPSNWTRGPGVRS